MALSAGTTVLHYRIVEKLGEGGMGQVWKAIDTSLDRPVAIKVLPDAFAADPDRLARFEQEARVLASLSHPGIAAVYSVHAHEGTRFLAMEMVEGEDLARVLARGRMSQEDALAIAIQIAAALEAAHDAGVVHRDLKPANIVLTPAGKVKVLDFGLAKALASAAASGSNPSLSPTMTSAGTVAGMILGTAGYMSPEQARGKAVDRRADIWAFGCILYEMLTGRRTFDGETVSDVLASVLKLDPEWQALPASTPPAVRQVLRQCLTRDVERRLGHASGARIRLQEVLDGQSEAETTPSATAVVAYRAPWSARIAWALVVLLALATGLALWWGATPKPSVTPMLSLLAPFPEGYAIPDNQMSVLTVSPEGRYLAMALAKGETSRLFLRKMETGDLTPLEGTEGATTPIFSPDGRWIAFFAEGKLKKVSVDGGKPITLCEALGDNRGASWGTDDRIVFTPNYTLPLSWVAGSGGAPQPLTTLDAAKRERTHRWPHSVAEHDVVLFTVGAVESPESYDRARIDAIRLSTGERKTVLEGASMARYLPSGHLLFGRDGFLFAVPFDIDRLETHGSAVPVVENVMGMRSSGAVHADLSRGGLLTYIAGSPWSRRDRLVWRERNGHTEPLPAPPAGYTAPRLSPDRTRIAVPVAGDNTFDVWVWDIARQTSTRLTFEGDNDTAVWSPDGQRIAFGSVRAGKKMSTYVKSADGSGLEEAIYVPPTEGQWTQIAPHSWSSNGQLLCDYFSDKSQSNILALDLRSHEPHAVLESPAAEDEPELSPDGRWLAYTSDESGRPQVYVRPFPGLEGRWQISDAGGLSARWSPDGKELFYRNENSLYAVRVSTEAGRFHADRPQRLFDDLPAANVKGNYDIFDRSRFLIVEPAERAAAASGVTVVVDWLDDLKRRVPR
jgi:serine/threonine-protein kinase